MVKKRLTVAQAERVRLWVDRLESTSYRSCVEGVGDDILGEVIAHFEREGYEIERGMEEIREYYGEVRIVPYMRVRLKAA